MQMTFYIDEIIVKHPELTKKVCFTPLGNIVVKSNVSENEYADFKKVQFKTSIQEKFYYKLHYMDETFNHAISWICIYYIPNDIYPYIRYSDGMVSERKPVPKELMEKFYNCKRYIEIELAFFDIIYHENIIGNKDVCKRKILNPLKRIIILKPSQKNKISFSMDYEKIKNKSYILEYENNLEKEKIMMREYGYIF